jgi:hypothetical protein
VAVQSTAARDQRQFRFRAAIKPVAVLTAAAPPAGLTNLPAISHAAPFGAGWLKKFAVRTFLLFPIP